MASKAIKGITIKLDGDTGELTSSLNDADRSLKSVENQLKAVDKALKLDPTNLDLIHQKQDLLNRAIEETKNKLDIEKQAAEQAAQALKDGTITQEQYDALQTEIQNTTTELKKLEDQAKQSSSAMGEAMTAAGDKIEAVGQKVTDVGKSLTTNVTGPIVGVAAASIAAFNEVDGALDQIAARTGATGTALAEMEDIAKNIATTIPTSFGTASQAVAAVNTRFGVTGKTLEDLSTQFVKFAELNGTDVTTAVYSAQSALAAWGLDASEAGSYLDYINTIGQRTGASVDDLNDKIAANAATFQDMGFNIADAAEFLGQVELSGADVSTVMTGLRKALDDASASGMPLSEALAQLQTDLQNAETDADAMQRAIDLFGTRAGPAMANMARQGKVSFSSLNSDLSSYKGNITTTYETTLDGTDKMSVAMNEVKLAGAELGASVADALVPIMEGLADILSELADWWDGLDESQQKVILTIVGIVAALGPLLVILGTLITNVGVVVGAFGTLSTFITATLIPALAAAGTTLTVTVIPAVIAAAPVILAVVAAVAAVIAVVEAVKSVIENSDAWIGFFTDLWNNLIDTLQNVWDAITSTVANIGDCLSDLWDDISGGFLDLLGDAWSWGVDLIQGFIDGIKSMAGDLWDTVSDVAGDVRDFLGFSEPKKGPLSNFHTYAPDMIDLWNEGIRQNLPSVQKSASDMAAAAASPLETTGSQLQGISGQLDTLEIGASPVNVAANIYLGNKLIQRQIVNTIADAEYLSGGGF